MWGALLAGATIVRVPDLVRADPFALQDFVHEHRITVMIVPTALFRVVALTAPATFGGLRHVVVGGEAVSSNAMRKVLETAPPENLWNWYGPAEATIYVTMGRVDQEEVQRPRISIGRSVGDTKIYLLDDNLTPIAEPGRTGEICIAGPQVSPGYLNRPDENEKSFVLIDAATLGVSSDEPVRVYRTGDLAQWRDDSGVLDYIGRADDQVKVSGYRVELGDIACCIEQHPQVHSCVVKFDQKGDVDYLEAYVIPADWDRDFRSEELIDWAKERLPSYMVPGMVYKKRSFPLSANGKVDRKALQPDNGDEQPCDEERGSHPKDTTEEVTRVDNGEMEDLADYLASILQEYLPKSETTPSDNFFSHGLTSLQAARLLGRIRQDCGKSITLAQLHQNPTVERLAKFMAGSVGKNTEQSDLERWAQDSKHLDIDLLPPDWQAEDEGRVFLTGGTGFLGAHVLHQLLSMPSVRKVACLARGRGDLSASARIQQTLEKYDLWDGRLETTQKIMVLEGDLGDNTLGLGEEQFKWLTDWASVIFHVGARVNWCEPYEAHYVPNVVGTRNVIRAAMSGRRKALHYVSSIDVWTVTGYINKVERVYEDEPLMPHLNAAPYDTGYSASQVVAEEIVQRARASGLPTAIYRPGFIIGHSEKAIANENDFFSRLIMGSIQSGYFPHLPTQRLEYVTVDYVTAAILHIASSRDNLGRAYHIVPPDRSRSVDYEQKYKMLRDLGYPVQMIEYRGWVEKIRNSPENTLEPMMPLLDEPVHGDLSRLQTSRNTPIYDPTNTARALQDRPDIKYVALDGHLLQQFIRNWVKRGQYRLDHHCKGCFDEQK